MGETLKQIKRLREWASELDSKPFREDEILKLVNAVIRSLTTYLPGAKVEHRNNKWVCNFGLKDVALIMIEPVHGSRNAIPQLWRKRQIDTIEEVLDRVESMVGGEQ